LTEVKRDIRGAQDIKVCRESREKSILVETGNLAVDDNELPIGFYQD
jgi:N-acetylmuramoyl-L-alanine amidase